MPFISIKEHDLINKPLFIRCCIFEIPVFYQPKVICTLKNYSIEFCESSPTNWEYKSRNKDDSMGNLEFQTVMLFISIRIHVIKQNIINA